MIIIKLLRELNNLEESLMQEKVITKIFYLNIHKKILILFPKKKV